MSDDKAANNNAFVPVQSVTPVWCNKFSVNKYSDGTVEIFAGVQRGDQFVVHPTSTMMGYRDFKEYVKVCAALIEKIDTAEAAMKEPDNGKTRQ